MSTRENIRLIARAPWLDFTISKHHFDIETLRKYIQCTHRYVPLGPVPHQRKFQNVCQTKRYYTPWVIFEANIYSED